ncbi:MAG: hypothetical protein MJ112_04915 [Lachnospiraceae bacterium]|nr:hypothetical protein [Lachnospiraceae bacterium]
MINFEEELKKFHPSLEIEQSEDAINNNDLTDMADLFINLVTVDYSEDNQQTMGQQMMPPMVGQPMMGQVMQQQMMQQPMMQQVMQQPMQMMPPEQ